MTRQTGHRRDDDDSPDPRDEIEWALEGAKEELIKLRAYKEPEHAENLRRDLRTALHALDEYEAR